MIHTDIMAKYGIQIRLSPRLFTESSVQLLAVRFRAAIVWHRRQAGRRGRWSPGGRVQGAYIRPISRRDSTADTSDRPQTVPTAAQQQPL